MDWSGNTRAVSHKKVEEMGGGGGVALTGGAARNKQQGSTSKHPRRATQGLEDAF